jgi:hypothetical protein
VGDTGLSFEDPGALELDVLGTEPVEESPAFSQQNRNQVDLQLVEEPRPATTAPVAIASSITTPLAPSGRPGTPP